MALVKVYPYKSWSITSGDWKLGRHHATMEYITENGLQAIIEGMKEVPQSSLDGEGRYIEKGAIQ